VSEGSNGHEDHEGHEAHKEFTAQRNRNQNGPNGNREFREFARMEFGSSKPRWQKPKPYSRKFAQFAVEKRAVLERVHRLCARRFFIGVSAPMIPLADAWPSIEPRVRAAAALAVGTDLDGTLAPFEDRPEAVALPASTRDLLRRLAAAPGVTLAVVSGRSLADVEARVDVPEAIRIGNHGYETRLPGRPRRAAFGDADLEAVRAAKAAMGVAAAAAPGAWLEDKGITAALHFRQAPPAALPALREAVRSAAARLPPAVRVSEGRCVYEIRPAGSAVNKGSAFRRALADAGVPPGALAWFSGDDLTDEDVFVVLPGDALTVHVGSPGDASAARFSASGPAEILAALERIVRLRTA
jgi:trehalose-phosphatase